MAAGATATSKTKELMLELAITRSATMPFETALSQPNLLSTRHRIVDRVRSPAKGNSRFLFWLLPPSLLSGLG
jgi:hypothetical protein